MEAHSDVRHLARRNAGHCVARTLANKRQQASNSPKANSQGSSQRSSTSSSSSSQPTANGCLMDQSLDTPCKQVAQLQLRPAKAKAGGKLLGSKSLSQLMPKYLFPKRNADRKLSDKSDKSNGCQEVAGQTAIGGRGSKGVGPSNRLASTRSFPSQWFHFNTIYLSSEMATTSAASSTMNCDDLQQDQLSIGRIESDSLIGLPRQSTCNSLGYFTDENRSLSPSNLSPIVGSQNEMMRNVVASTPTLRMRSMAKLAAKGRRVSPPKGMDVSNEAKRKAACERGSKVFNKPFKSTALVLRDVKNSLGLRIKAKRESKAFAKLTNEISTPDTTKLYSPFNIYTPSASKEPKQQQQQLRDMKAKRTLNLNKSFTKTKLAKSNDSGNCSATSNASDQDNCSGGQSGATLARTPKNRIALRHKRHLFEASNKFTFDSPTGRLRETVKEVEQFQQCIEDISKAIRARGSSLAD